MFDLEESIVAAWKKIAPTLLSDRDELAHRLARRRRAMLTRPPRAWCLAIRAADTRINPFTARIVPEDAAYPRSHLAGDARRNHQYPIAFNRGACTALDQHCAGCYLHDSVTNLGASQWQKKSNLKLIAMRMR